MKTTGKAKEYTLTCTTNEFQVVQIRCGEDAAKFARQFYHEDIEIYESAFIILLNQRCKTIGWAKISQGGVSAVLVDVRLVAKYAIDALASSVIFVHNHPSGDLIPSEPDRILTKKLKEGLKLLDVNLLDSIIIAPGDGYYSFQDEGLL